MAVPSNTCRSSHNHWASNSKQIHQGFRNDCRAATFLAHFHVHVRVCYIRYTSSIILYEYTMTLCHFCVCAVPTQLLRAYLCSLVAVVQLWLAPHQRPLMLLHRRCDGYHCRAVLLSTRATQQILQHAQHAKQRFWNILKLNRLRFLTRLFHEYISSSCTDEIMNFSPGSRPK